MHLDRLQVELRARNAWEAMDLGVQLSRRHFGLIFRASLIASAPYALTLIGLAYALVESGWFEDALLWAPLLIWWIKPVFDRVPAFVLSRAAFDATPSLRETLSANWTGGLRVVLPWLFFRRFYDWGRALTLTADLLERQSGKARRERRSVLHGAVSGQSILLTLICLGIEAVLFFSLVALVLLFVPFEYLDESAKQLWSLIIDAPPPWADALTAVIGWVVAVFVGVFYMGAGFGLYLHRRTQLEAWDIELRFRRLAARLSDQAQSVLLAMFMILPTIGLLTPVAASASVNAAAPAIDAAQADADAAAKAAHQAYEAAHPAHDLDTVFRGSETAADPRWADDLEQVRKDPLLAPDIVRNEWQLKNPRKQTESNWKHPAWLKTFADALATLFSGGAWLLLGLIVLAILLTAPRWLPWFRSLGQRVEEESFATESRASAQETPLPSDIVGSARALWRSGQTRDALGLLYRAAVRRLDGFLGGTLPPGSTEAQCLRMARRLDAPDFQESFQSLVRTWQRAAYAHRLPSDEEFESLLALWPRLERRA